MERGTHIGGLRPVSLGGTDVGISRFRLADTFRKATALGSASADTRGFHLQFIAYDDYDSDLPRKRQVVFDLPVSRSCATVIVP